MSETVPDVVIPMITITLEEYTQLLEDSEWLYALEAAGVDNWEGYSHAQDLREEIEEEDEDA